ncbi:threonine ammonia-lyase [Umezawaea beigongshangensis]|uniref:threonine ammonia-lyase n=1 Tax=Umezawaea beigongshangensis TaxID=2780383 RepID=UPI001E404801|nr:pyridoxal-phosphate dependent enzyme [Umezawaea beigongshangensis]
MDVDLGNVERAARTIDPVFRRTPQYRDDLLDEALDARVVVKVETANPLRSFKGRGVDFATSRLERGTRVVCASAGNFGQALAYVGRKRGFHVEVFVSATASESKVERMRAMGARVVPVEGDFTDAKTRARDHARGGNRVFLEDGREPALAEGAGSIAVELLPAGPFDTIYVPLGDGSLIAGIAVWSKKHAPRTRVVGVCAQGAPSMADSWQVGQVVQSDRADTIADGLAVRTPVRESLTRLVEVVDDVVLVSDDAMRSAVDLARRTLGLVLEPSGAAGLAAIAAYAPSRERCATVLTGGNADPGE